MKKYLTLLIIAILFSSCESWFDVRPAAQVKESELFETQDGFKRALIGVYSVMGQNHVYGKEGTMSVMEIVADIYTSVDAIQNHEYEALTFPDYKHYKIEPKINALWAGNYNAIVNINNILDNIEDKKELLDDEIYRIIKGEALGLRALIHFDILRMFAPAPKNNLDVPAIPYMDHVDYVSSPQLTINEVIEYVIQDVDKAKILLNEIDPITKDNYWEDFNRMWTGDEEIFNNEGFLINRRLRMNYYAVTGLKARVHMYRGNVEDKVEAAKNAAETINSNIFKLMTNAKLSEASSTDFKMLNCQEEYLFSLYKYDLAKVNKKIFETETSDKVELHIDKDKRNKIFEVDEYGGSADWRHTLYFERETEGIKLWLSKYKYVDNIPIIKISEMYLILAECTQNFQPLITLRSSRGLKKIKGPDQTLDTQLFLEYRREMLGEGQTFYFLKRKEMLPKYGWTIDDMTFPIPDSEKEFGNIENN